MDETKFPDIFNEPEPSNPQPPIKKIFVRSNSDVIIAGVCSGIAKYTNTEPALIRILAMLTLLFGGWSVAVYLIIAALTPVENNKVDLTSDEILQQKRINYKTILSGSMILTGIYFGFKSIGYFSSERLFVLPNNFILPLVAIIIGVLILTNRLQTKKHPGNHKKYFHKSHKDKRLLGVCGGIAEYTEIDSTLIRTVFFISTLLTLGIWAVVYFILALSSENEKIINDINT